MPEIEKARHRTWPNAGAPVNGVTYAGQAPKGDILEDTVNGALYQNTGTQAVPVWTQVGTALVFGLVGDMAANGTAVANAVGVSGAPCPVDHVHKIGVHDHSDNTKGDKIVEAGITPNSLTGLVVANVADANVIGGIPVVHRIAIADVGAPTNYDVVLTHKTKIIDAWIIKAGNNGGAGDKVSLYHVTDGAAITNDIDLDVVDKTRVGVTTIDDAHDTILAGGTLRVIATKATHCNCVMYVLGLRSA